MKQEGNPIIYKAAERFIEGADEDEIIAALSEGISQKNASMVMRMLRTSRWQKEDWGYVEFLSAVNTVLGQPVYEVFSPSDSSDVTQNSHYEDIHESLRVVIKAIDSVNGQNMKIIVDVLVNYLNDYCDKVEDSYELLSWAGDELAGLMHESDNLSDIKILDRLHLIQEQVKTAAYNLA
ncbi:hypothetical protein [Sporomusa acidovorans]|uniref:Uncharacterized protein n=1 Tax=Sporomusa acidovorans (strain ATCC 49682 / DSM 3132 / Mol) TaxID=1123286 RepID=A0ABZ3J970_SPOA4|nr:hypothetical protein [Sporomusa acidovorans]OZC22952.1 hypothetical protein SPACI_10250 [Sporomusa acidovorans DSM 3132]SDE94109.1 hypothetical protein SAMN04488499_102728 [Sporomusa acidovorans]